ncbi:hypothetical protein [Micromonospora sp. NPDC003816]|nr:hypothetical protein HUT12_15680 [Verrucosispora sp. NA02020]
MTRRPTEDWGREVEDQKGRIAVGTLAEHDAWALHLWPEPFIAAIDAALDAYEADVRALSAPSDAEIFAPVKRVVMALNAIDEGHGSRIETGERESLCEYIDDALSEVGVDVDGLTHRRGIDRAELTDEWRDW